VFAAFNAVETFGLLYILKKISRKVDNVIPDGSAGSGGALIASALIEFMGRIQAQGPEGDRAREVVGTFVKSVSLAAVDTALERFPAAKNLANAGMGGSLSDVLPKKYQWVGGVIDLFGPQIAQAAQHAAAAQKPATPSGGRNVGASRSA